MGYFAAKFAPANGTEKNMDSRTIPTTAQLGINNGKNDYGFRLKPNN